MRYAESKKESARLSINRERTLEIFEIENFKDIKALISVA